MVCMAKSVSPRAANRRYILRVLAAVKRKTGDLHAVWNVSGTVYPERRPRTVEEFPENDAVKLRELYHHLDDMIRGLQVMQREVYRQLVEVQDASSVKPQS